MVFELLDKQIRRKKKYMKKAKYFTAEWCAPCQMFKPLMEEIAKEYPVEIINVDEDEVTPTQYDISAVPTVIIEDENGEVERFIGPLSKADVINKLR